MSTVRAGGVRFRIYPQDHEPVHAHGRYAETIAIVELRADGSVVLAECDDAIIPTDAKRNDVRKILKEAAAAFNELVAAWEKMHQS